MAKTIIAIAALVQLSIGNAEAESHLLVLTIDPSTQLELTGSSITSDTVPYDLEPSSGLKVMLEIETSRELGAVATSIAFEPPTRTWLFGASMTVTIPTSYGPIPLFTEAVDWFGQVAPHQVPVPATPLATNRSSFDISSFHYDIVGGFTAVGAGTPAFTMYEHSAEPLEFALSGNGELRIIPHPPFDSATVILTLPIDATASGTVPIFSLAGDLVLTGEVPLDFEVLPLAWPVSALTSLLLLAAGWKASGRLFETR